MRRLGKLRGGRERDRPEVLVEPRL